MQSKKLAKNLRTKIVMKSYSIVWSCGRLRLYWRQVESFGVWPTNL